MKDKTHNLKRREFFNKLMATGMVSCFGINALLGQNSDSEEVFLPENSKHKFQENSEMSYQAIFNFAYKSWLIPFMKTFSDELGKEELINLLKKASGNRAKNIANYWLKKVSSNDFNGFKEYVYKAIDNPFMQNIGTFEISDESENVIQMTCKECLWAKTFREAQAADIGYACTCHQDFKMAESFNPKIKLRHNTKSLMEGGSECTLRWTFES